MQAFCTSVPHRVVVPCDSTAFLLPFISNKFIHCPHFRKFFTSFFYWGTHMKRICIYAVWRNAAHCLSIRYKHGVLSIRLNGSSWFSARTDGSFVFARLRQCAPHLIHASLSLPSPQSKRHLDPLSYFCAAQGRVSSGMPGHVRSHKNCPLAWGELYPNLIHSFLGQPDSTRQTASRSV